MAPEPFTVAIPDSAVEDLHTRLARTRWPEAETVDDWSQGCPLAYLQEVCEYWRTTYDWGACQDRLNSFEQFRTEIDGVGIHFIHAPSPVPGALPVVMTHGWPGSVLEFLDVIGPLTNPAAHGGDPADAISLVVPSLPGYGFSDRPDRTGIGVEWIGRAWGELMGQLGYDRFGAQGGDWGSVVTEEVSRQNSDHVVGVHLNIVFTGPPTGDLTPEEERAKDAFQYYQRWESGYAQQQSTRPQTLGYGLVDSPAGQCAWILEKFRAWTDCDGHPENSLTRDQLLDNVSLYWFTQTAASSARLYWESFNRLGRGRVDVPMGASIFPAEIFRPSRRTAEEGGRLADVRYWGDPPRGGHFAAFEVPDLFVEEVRNFFRLVR